MTSATLWLGLVLLCCVQDIVLCQKRIYKPGYVIIGGLTSLHRREGAERCGKFDVPALGIAEAIVYAVQEINNNSNLLPNITLGYDIRDCCQSPVLGAKHGFEFAFMNTKAAENYDNYLRAKPNSSVRGAGRSQGILAVIGGQLSQTALVVSPLLQAIQLPLVESLATSEQLGSVLHKDVLRTIPSDGNQAKAIAEIITKYGWNYIAAIAEDDSYGRSGIMALERRALKLNFCLGIIEFVPQGRLRNRIPTIVYKLKQRKTVRVIVLWVLHSTGKTILEEVIKQGLYDRTWIMSESLAMQQPEYLGRDILSRGHFIGVLPRRRIYPSFQAHLEQVTPSTATGNPWWEELWNTEFNCTTNMKRGRLPKCSAALRLTGENVHQLMNDFIPFVIDAVYTVARALNLCMLDRCAREFQSSVGSHDFVERMRSIEFDGLTGRIGFDEYGDPLNAVYDIVWVHTLEDMNGTLSAFKATVGSWEKRRFPNLVLNDTFVYWQSLEHGEGYSECSEECEPGERKSKSTQCCWECVTCPEGYVTKSYGELNCSKCPRFQKSNSARTACVDLPLINLKWTDITAIIMLSITILGIFLAFLILGILLKYLDTPIVKASNPEISFILLLDTVFCFVLIFLYLATPSDPVCRILQPLRYVAFTCSTAVLILKTMRIVQAFEMAPVKTVVKACIKSASRQLMSLVALLFLDLLLAACWVIVDPPHLKKNLTQDGHIFLSCQNYRSTFGQALNLAMLSYLIALGLFCAFYAFKARKLPGNFNEAKYIAFSMYIFLLSWITYFPIGFAMQGWYVAIVSCTTALVSSYGLLGCIFAPKIYLIFRHPEKNTPSAVRKELQNFSRVGTFNESGESST